MATKNLYQRVCNGDKLTNKEVVEGAEFFKDLADKLYAAGPAFAITAKEANRTHHTLHSFAQARKLVD